MKSKLTHITHHEAYLYSLLEASSEIIVFLTAEGNITEFNSLAEKIFGLNKTCDIGKSFYSLYQNKQIQMPFSQVEFTALMKGDTSSIESTVLENNNKTFLLWGINDLSTYNLSASGFIITGRNITDKKNFETQLLSNRNQLETISACVPGNFYWKDTKLQYRGCNDSLLKMLGLNSVEDIMNKSNNGIEDAYKRIIGTGEEKWLPKQWIILPPPVNNALLTSRLISDVSSTCLATSIVKP